MPENEEESITEDATKLHLEEEPAPRSWDELGAYTKTSTTISTAGVIAKDITSAFAEASSALRVGQLVKDDWFTLFESVAALEIMDPKMDSGFLKPGERLDEDYDVTSALLPEEVVGIIDQLICHEMAWHMGHPLSQTLFTSLHLDNLLWPSPKALGDAQFGGGTLKGRGGVGGPLHTVLRAYCLALIKCCGYVYSRIQGENYYEEEDFVSNLFNRELLDGIQLVEFLSLLDEAQSILERCHMTISKSVREALDLRLECRRAFLLVLSFGLQIAPQPSDHHHLNRLAEISPKLTHSAELGKPVKAAFSAKIQRRLASTVPPRPIVDIKFQDAVDHFTRLCQDGRELMQILHCYGSNNIMTFAWTFISRKPQPSIFLRAVLQHLLFGSELVLGQTSIQSLLYDDIGDLIGPCNALLDLDAAQSGISVPNRIQISRRMNSFTQKFRTPFSDIHRTFCQNRSRIRRIMCHSILDWDSLQVEAEELDAELRGFTLERPLVDASISTESVYSYPLSSWAYHQKLQQMTLVVQLGFELEIYQADELAGMYWYLQNIIQNHRAHLERIRVFLLADLRSAKKDIEKLRVAESLSYLNYHRLRLTATQSFADALTCFHTILKRWRLVPVPDRPYSSDLLRYELRMKPFLPVSLPEPIPFANFEELSTQPNESIKSLLNTATEAVTRSRKDFDLLSKMDSKTTRSEGCRDGWIKDIKDTQRACIAASIALSTMRKANDAGTKTKLQVQIDMGAGKGYHDWWVVPKVSMAS